MKRIISVVLMVISVIILSGCLNEVTPSDVVKDMFDDYINNSKTILEELDEYVEKQDLSSEEKKRYKDIIKKEYSTIKYNILEENIEETTAQVVVSIDVLDLYYANEQAERELLANPMNFYTDGSYDVHKFIDYKLTKMENNEKRVEYTLHLKLMNSDGEWVLDELDDTTLEKIHGIYNYEEN